MLLVSLSFESGTGIHWRLNGAGPPSFPLRGTDWNLLNPLLWHQTYPGPTAPFTELNSCQFIGGTGEIVFLHKTKKKEDFSKSDEAYVTKLGLQLLTILRHVSGQARAPQGRHLAMTMSVEIQRLPIFAPVRMPQFGPMSVSKYWFDVAITEDHIKTATDQKEGFEPDVYKTLFLDAITAYFENDFRTSILYAAMSMEVACGAVIDAQHAKIIAGQQDDRYRVIRIPTAGGLETVKDPVFDKLRKETNFAVRMHELPLYVIGKSLLVEDQSLYTQANNLYATRNKLVHSGVVDDSGSTSLLPLDQQGSFKALEAAKKVLMWLNVDSGITLPVVDFLPIEK